MKRTNFWAGTALFAMAMLLAVPVQAQQSLNEKDAQWWDQLEMQLIESLDAPVEQIQVETIQHIIFFASNYGEEIDLANATPALLDMYTANIGDERRTMALVALHAIGNEASMRQLAILAETQDDDSVRMRNLARTVLADYYGG